VRLIVFSGLPGVGKTTIARAAAARLGAVYLRIDSIEQVLRNAGFGVEGEGYEVAYRLAADNLALGRIVIADCVNPWPLTRDQWRLVAERQGAVLVDVEVTCSDVGEHRRRVESRVPDIPGQQVPTWSDVRARDYVPWHAERVMIDTSRVTLDGAVQRILDAAR
jgi:predicted kinase